MKVYLDVSCLNRPLDDQNQARIHLEAEAVILILQRVDAGLWSHVSSDIAAVEINAITDSERRARVQMLLPDPPNVLPLTSQTFKRAARLEELGLKPADALHVAAAEEAGVDVFLSCDDRLCRLARRHRRQLKVAVANPLDWLKELGDAANT